MYDLIEFKMKFMEEIKKWFVVYTRSRCEKKVYTVLTKRGVESYCPLNKCLRNWSDRKKVILEPLFRSYVFVRVSRQEIEKIKQHTSDIVNVVYWLGSPAIVREDEIKQIQLFLGEYQNVKIEKREVRINDDIKIIQGPLMNKIGRIGEIRKNMVKILIPSLGYMLSAEVKISNIEIMDINLDKTKQELLLEMQ
jgi:transcription antitermination factor NusG